MKALTLISSTILLFSIVLSSGVAQQQDNGVSAQAQDQVNIRAEPGIEATLLGQMTIGTPYPVIGRSDIFPWILLGDPVTQEPIGWVYQEITIISGNLNSVPFSTLVVTDNPTATAAAPTLTLAPNSTPLSRTATLAPSATPAFTVAGTTQGEVNIRYGPGTNYQRIGVAQAGDRFQVTAWHTQLPWVQIRYDSSPTGYGWIAIDLLVVEGDIYSLPAISTTVFNLPTLTPTPSVVQSSSTLGGSTVSLSPEFAALGNRIFQLMLTLGFDPQTSRFGSLFVLDLQTGEALSIGSDIAYRGTSVNKINILAALYGTLQAPPTEDLAVDIANTMICSENSSTNRLISVIGNGDEWQGSQTITNFMQQLGMTNSFLLAPYTVDPENPPIPPYPIPVPETEADQEKAHPEPYNQLTVDDMGWLLGSIYQCGYQEGGALLEVMPAGMYEPRECRQMIHVMASNTVDGLLKAGVPAGTRVAHKHGWIDDTHANAGIFFTPGGDYVVVMAFHSTQLDAQGNRYLAFGDTLPVFAETSRMIYNYFNPDAPMPAIREGFIPEAPTCNFAGTPLITDLQQAIWDQ